MHRSTGYLLICNLIVGTGALALPKAFQSAGFVLSIVLLFISAFTSYMAATYIIEAMAIANADQHRMMLRKDKDKNEAEVKAAYDITKRVEVSSMAKMFLGRYGVMFLSLIMTIYLFGDLAIYSTTVPKSLMNVICGSVKVNHVKNSDPCYDTWPAWLTRQSVYRLVVAAFTVFVTPLVIIGVTRTKYMQMATSACRWIAFLVMIALACVQFSRHGAIIPRAVSLHGFGSLFGTTVYAFMCHHSLPSLITPMKSKKRVNYWLMVVYVVIFVFYFLLAMTGSLAFKELFDVYSLNFLHSDATGIGFDILNYFLALFPVFTLTSNYPIVANTLVNNFLVLLDIIYELWFYKLVKGSTVQPEPDSVIKVDLSNVPEDNPVPVLIPNRDFLRFVVILIIIAIATVIALCTDNVLILATVTGSYPGVGVQYVIPALLIIFGRRYSHNQLGSSVPNWISSPFRQNFWAYIMFGWSGVSIIMTTLNLCKVFDKL